MGNYKRNNCNKKDSEQCGIYSITNLINGKRYIGQTYDFKYRWMRHKSYLKHNTEHNAHLQNAWNKYGSENFIFEIIENCSFEELDEREIYWIKYYDSKNNGYNFADGGLGCKGYKHSEEEIHKMRLIQNPKPIVQLDLKGNYLNTFISTGEACDYINKNSASGIKRCCEKDKYRQAYGYIWVYEEDYLFGNIDWDYYFEEAKNKPKPVLQYDLNMNLINEWESANEAGIKNNMFGGSIASTCNGKYDTYKGFIWVWKNNPEIYYKNKEKRKLKSQQNKILKQKIILQFSKDNIFIREWTNQEIKENDYNLKTIQSCCNGHTKTYQGYIWRYKTK